MIRTADRPHAVVYWNGLVREEQATVAEHARHVADSQGLFERVVVDEHVGRDYQIEQARTLITREAFEHDVQLAPVTSRTASGRMSTARART